MLGLHGSARILGTSCHNSSRRHRLLHLRPLRTDVGPCACNICSLSELPKISGVHQKNQGANHYISYGSCGSCDPLQIVVAKSEDDAQDGSITRTIRPFFCHLQESSRLPFVGIARLKAQVARVWQCYLTALCCTNVRLCVRALPPFYRAVPCSNGTNGDAFE